MSGSQIQRCLNTKTKKAKQIKQNPPSFKLSTIKYKHKVSAGSWTYADFLSLKAVVKSNVHVFLLSCSAIYQIDHFGV